MKRPDFNRYFHEYAELYNKALGDNPDYQAIMDRFTDCFVAAGPTGVQCGRNGEELRTQLEQGYAFYKKIGTQSMSVIRTLETQIDEAHNLVKVFYRAAYVKGGKEITIDFDVSYLLQTRDGVSKIFAFVAGDEMAEYKRAGLLD